MNRNLENLFFGLAWKIITKVPEPWTASDVGRPPYDQRPVALACMAKLMFNKTYEGTESWTGSSALFTELTGYKRIPQSVIHRGMEHLTKDYIKQVCKKLTIQFRRKGIEVVVDASGFKLRTSSTWYDIRIQRKTRRKDHLKLHIAGDFQTGIIHSFTVTGGRKGDSPQFRELLSVIQKVLKAAGDSAYLSRKNCTLVKEKGGKPYFKIKCNVSARPKSSPEWKAMIKLYQKDPDNWLKEYHIRSYVEAMFAAVKKRFGNFLRSIKTEMQEKELSLKIICYNIIRVLYIQIARILDAPLWIKV